MGKYRNGGDDLNKVDPIKDMEDVKRLLNYFKTTNKRNYILALFGFYNGLRISDILPIKVGDIRNKNYIRVVENKREYRRTVVMPSKVRKEIDAFIEGKSDDEFVFKSRQGYNHSISASQAYRILNEGAKAVGIRCKVGTHTLRKTFAYHLYKNGVTIAEIQSIIGHTDSETTKMYLGIDIDEINAKVSKLGFI